MRNYIRRKQGRWVVTKALGTVYVSSLRPGRWERWDGDVSYVFEQHNTYGPNGKFWTLPSPVKCGYETANTLEGAVSRWARHYATARAVVKAFGMLHGWMS